jgi:hypothetical protein
MRKHWRIRITVVGQKVAIGRIHQHRTAIVLVADTTLGVRIVVARLVCRASRSHARAGSVLARHGYPARNGLPHVPSPADHTSAQASIS